MNEIYSIPQTAESRIRQILETVADPEIPVLSVLDMGIVREIHTGPDGTEILITPTYSGCPAMDLIAVQIKLALEQAGYSPVHVKSVLSPSWTTDWMTESGKKKLQEYGIAPPEGSAGRLHKMLFADEIAVTCPRCHSKNTRLLSQFGSTACKALYQCNDCREPFDYFKCH